MTIEEFIETRPQNYGTGNVNLLLSSSVANLGVDDTPIPPFTIQGVAIPNISKEGVDISSALREIQTLRFDFTEGQVSTRIVGKQKKTGYFYYLVEPIQVDTYPTQIGPGGETEFRDSEFVFVPYVQTSFNNNDYNPLINNSEGSKVNSVAKQVDRNSSQSNPTNLSAILNGSAAAAEIQNCSYTKVGLITGRYNGTKSTSAPTQTEFHKQRFTDLITSRGIEGNEPALAFTTFKGSLHSLDSPNNIITSVIERKEQDLYFNSTLILSGSTFTYPNFPIVGSFVYKSDGNKKVRVVSQKIYGIEDGSIYTVTETGEVILKTS